MEPNVDKKSNGAFIGSVIVVIILILGGLYVWKNKDTQINLPNNEIGTENDDQSSAVINAYNELEAFDQELVNTDTNVDVNIDKIQ